jgi:HEPN domain-containing protein
LPNSTDAAGVLLKKAEQDRYVMDRLLADPAVPDEAIGFHAQQAVEKAIKAVLAHQRIAYRRTHNLKQLVRVLNDAGVSCPPELSEAAALTPFAVELRYDMLPVHDDDAPPFDRQWAERCVARIAEWASSIVGEQAAGQ